MRAFNGCEGASTNKTYPRNLRQASKDQAVRNLILQSVGNRVWLLQQPVELNELNSTSSSPLHPPDKAPKPAKPVRYARAVHRSVVCFPRHGIRHPARYLATGRYRKHRKHLFRGSIVQIRVLVKVNSSCGGYRCMAGDCVVTGSPSSRPWRITHKVMLQRTQGPLKANYLINSFRLSFKVTRSSPPMQDLDVKC